MIGIVGDGTRGWPENRFFDRILVSAGIAETPRTLLNQRAEDGAMLIRSGERSTMRLVLYTSNNGREERPDLLPVRFLPLPSGVHE